jgi:hypothetical protein
MKRTVWRTRSKTKPQPRLRLQTAKSAQEAKTLPQKHHLEGGPHHKCAKPMPKQPACPPPLHVKREQQRPNEEAERPNDNTALSQLKTEEQTENSVAPVRGRTHGCRHTEKPEPIAALMVEALL